MKTKHKKRTGLSMTVAATSLLASAFSSEAAVTSGTASGMALHVNFTTLNLVGLNVGPLSGTSITTPNPDAAGAVVNNQVLNVNQSVLLVGGVVAQNGTDNALTSSSTSNVTGVAMNGSSSGISTVNGLSLNIIGLLSLSSDTITSNSSSSGSYGSLLSAGDSLIEGLTLTVGPLNTVIDLTAFINAEGKANPNTVINLAILETLGLTITLNEQIVTGNGIGGTAITTNAIRISVDANLVGLGLVDGDIIIGQSTSGLTAIPEPSTAAALGLVGVGFMLRRRR